MSMIETIILREPWDVDRRLAELHLGPLTRLLKVVAVAISAGADATAFHPANAAGTFSYQHGTWALRDEFVGDAWLLDRPDGVEAIRNDATKVKVIFANVDVSCNDKQKPKPRSRKGAGAERVSSGTCLARCRSLRLANPMGGLPTTLWLTKMAPQNLRVL